MSWVVTGAAVLSIGSTVGSMISGAFGAQTKGQARDLTGLAEEMKQEQLGLLGEQKGIARSSAKLGMAAAESQFAGGRRDVTAGTQMGMRGVQEFGDTATSKAGLATSGTIQQKVSTQTSDILGKYKSDMTKLLDTRRLSKAEADLSYRSGKMSAEDAYESMKTELESQPTGFLEGMFS